MRNPSDTYVEWNPKFVLKFCSKIRLHPSGAARGRWSANGTACTAVISEADTSTFARNRQRRLHARNYFPLNCTTAGESIALERIPGLLQAQFSGEKSTSTKVLSEEK